MIWSRLMDGVIVGNSQGLGSQTSAPIEDEEDVSFGGHKADFESHPDVEDSRVEDSALTKEGEHLSLNFRILDSGAREHEQVPTIEVASVEARQVLDVRVDPTVTIERLAKYVLVRDASGLEVKLDPKVVFTEARTLVCSAWERLAQMTEQAGRIRLGVELERVVAERVAKEAYLVENEARFAEIEAELAETNANVIKMKDREARLVSKIIRSSETSKGDYEVMRASYFSSFYFEFSYFQENVVGICARS
ncbi:hypothetical protein U1Q18_010239 [Sarracenia purpurea var. burkii]